MKSDNDFAIYICYNIFIRFGKEGTALRLDKEDFISISQLLDVKMDSALRPIKEEIGGIRKELGEVKEELGEVKEEFGEVKEEVEGMKGELGGVKDELGEVKEEVEGMKGELGGVKDELGAVKDRLQRVELHIENVTDHNIRLLAENYVPAAKRYEKAISEMDEMKSDIEVMKVVIANHSKQLGKLA